MVTPKTSYPQDKPLGRKGKLSYPQGVINRCFIPDKSGRNDGQKWPE